MPELPEVESIRRLLEQSVRGAQIVDAAFPAPQTLKFPTPDVFQNQVCLTRLEAIGRRGKYLLFSLAGRADSYDLLAHLRMRGEFRVEPSQEQPQKYLCAELRLHDGRSLRYYDMWRWGEWSLFPAGTALTHPALAELGPEPFDARFTPDYLAQELTRRRGLLKPLLLEQRLVAGLGNIYCDECLHRARLHPTRNAQSVQPDEAARLHEAIQAILRVAITQGGAYADKLAQAQAPLDDFSAVYEPQVYDRAGQPCPTCAEPLVKVQLRGRGTTFCPICQPTSADNK